MISFVASAIWTNYLWIPKSSVKGDPSRFAPEWEYRIELLKTPEGKIAQQQIAFLREQAIDDGEDPDDVVQNLTEEDFLLVKNWGETKDWWTFCSGNITKVQMLAKRLGLDIKDKRVDAPFAFKTLGLSMQMTARPHQVPAMKLWAEANHGMLQAAPAFGKTFSMVSSILERGQHTMVLVHTDALADQFITRFRHGSPNDDGTFTPITNCLEVEEREGIELIGRFRGKKLFPVTVATWQSFTSDLGRKTLKDVGKKFGYLLVDEAHVFAAAGPASVVNGFHAKVKAGVTATPTRKDQMDVALNDILGPVTAVGKSEQLAITSYLISTGCSFPARRHTFRGEWSRILNWLVKQEERNDLITKWLRHDVKADRNILVLCERRNWCLEMTDAMNKLGYPSRAVLGGISSKRGIEDRNKAISDMMNGDVKIIFATSVFKAGVDIPCLDTLYYTLPQNNQQQLQQALGRIRRLYEDKKNPVFRYFVDEGHGMLYGCARGTQNALVTEGSEIILVSEGKKPGAVHTSRSFDSEEIEQQGSFKSISNKQRSALSSLFTDLRKEEKLTAKYNKKLGRTRNA